MLLPEEERHNAISKALRMLEDPETKILAYYPTTGVVLQDRFGTKLTITRHSLSVDFQPAPVLLHTVVMAPDPLPKPNTVSGALEIADEHARIINMDQTVTIRPHEHANLKRHLLDAIRKTGHVSEEVAEQLAELAVQTMMGGSFHP